MQRDGPDETEQFPSQCGHDLILVFVASRKRLVAFVQTLLRLPGYLLDFVAERQILLPPQEEACHVRTVLIRARRFHQHPSEVTVAGFGDASAPHAIPIRAPPGRCNPSVDVGFGNGTQSQVRRRWWPPSFAPLPAVLAALRSPPGSPAAPSAPPHQGPSPVSQCGPRRDPLPPGNRPASPP